MAARNFRLPVSVIIPAFRPTYLTQAIASVLTQGFEDFELIVSDDCRSDDVRTVVDRFKDPRLRYVKSDGVGATANILNGWNLAQHELVKYLFDDDLFTPNALIDLVELCQQHPEAMLSFGHRQVIDEMGRITDEPKFLAESKTALIAGNTLRTIVARDVRNPIGEFSNVLFNRANGLTAEDFLTYEGFQLRMIGDAGIYLNAAHRGPVVGVGRVVGAFRRHANQFSSPAYNPLFAKSVCEWELFLRGEFGLGAVSAQDTLSGLERLERGYNRWKDEMPELVLLREGLARLKAKIVDGDRDTFDDGFRADWAEVDARVMKKAEAHQAS